MRCSSFEPLLDAYVDGELSPARRARIAAHLDSCTECAAILAELRVIDGLLLEPRQLEPAPNFTFRVMAEARCLPAPRAHHLPHFAVLGTYVVFAWAAIGAFLAFGGGAARAMLATIGNGFARAATQVSALAAATGHVFGHQAYDVTAAMGVMIGADMVIVAAVVALYAFLRARRATGTGSTEPC
jgi:anti-sigma factor RsiW